MLRTWSHKELGHQQPCNLFSLSIYTGPYSSLAASTNFMKSKRNGALRCHIPWTSLKKTLCRADCSFAASQWQTALLWLGSNLQSAVFTAKRGNTKGPPTSTTTTTTTTTKTYTTLVPIFAKKGVFSQWEARIREIKKKGSFCRHESMKFWKMVKFGMYLLPFVCSACLNS